MKRYRCLDCGFLAPMGGPCPRCEGRAALRGAFPSYDSRARWITNYPKGFRYYFLGFTFLGDHPGLLKWVVIPLVLNLALFGALVTGGIFCIDPLLEFLDAEWPGFLEWLREAVWWILAALIGVLAILVSLVLTLLLSTVINAPFFELLSEAVESIYLGRRFDEKWTWEYIQRTILVPLWESLKLMAFELSITLVLVIISFISAGLGSVLFAVAGPYFASLTIFDYVMSRKAYHLNEKRNFMRDHRALTMGFGTPVYIVPFLTPVAVVGATLFFLEARPNSDRCYFSAGGKIAPVTIFSGTFQRATWNRHPRSRGGRR